MATNPIYQAKIDANVARLEGLLAAKERLLEKSESKRRRHAARVLELEAELRVAEDQANNNAADAIQARADEERVRRYQAEAVTQLAAAQARAAEAEAVIAGAPHDDLCKSFLTEDGWHHPDCDCWKSTAPSEALARVKAEAKAEALREEAEKIRGYTLDFTTAVSMLDHVLRLIERDAGFYRAGAD